MIETLQLDREAETLVPRVVARHGTPHLQAKGFERGLRVRTVECHFIGHMYNEAEAVLDAIDTLPSLHPQPEIHSIAVAVTQRLGLSASISELD